jgi:integrase
VESTGCKDEQAARRVLAEWERKAELVRSGVITSGEAAVADHQGTPLAKHFEAFGEYLRAKDVTRIHREDTARYLDRLAAECPFGTLADLRREALERWLAARAKEGMSARSRNAYRNALVSFCNWCVDTDRLTVNLFLRVAKANEKADRRRQRRALTEEELVKLLAVARERPLLEALTVRKGPRKCERYANVRPEVKERLEILGRERALIYKALVLTGLRRNELASLTVAHLRLDEPVPLASLDAADEKNREGNSLPLRDDLAADLRDWLASKLERMQQEALQQGAPIPARLPPDTPVFEVPAALVKILDRDLVLAGIAKRVKVGNKWRIDKRDDRGRTIDVHALRTTFGTLLSKGGVAPRTAQAAMRHSDIKLTMGVYTDPKLLDVRGALDALPALSLDGSEREAAQATGTDGEPARFAPGFAPTRCKPVQTVAIPDKTEGEEAKATPQGADAITSIPVKGKGRLSSPDNRPSQSGRLDSNQRPPEPHIGGLTTWFAAKSVKWRHPAVYGFHALHILQGVGPPSRLIPGFPGYSLPFPAAVPDAGTDRLQAQKCLGMMGRSK